jgi:methionine biosynthesis protein MetW
MPYPDSGREEFHVIANLITSGSKILDLGCGNGVLLQQLQKERSTSGKGMELTTSGVQVCRAKGLDVIQGRIDERLPFEDNSFNYTICNVTIQMVMYPEILLSEMKRVARFQIVTFPNFAFYRNRVQFALRGVMPPHMLYGYRWYTTGHIHQLSIKDFKQLVNDVGGLAIREILSVNVKNPFKQFLIETIPNLFMLIPIILLEKTA